MPQLRQDRMTLDERMVALLNRKRTDRIPFYGLAGGFSAKNVGFTVEDFYKDHTGQAVRNMALWTSEQYGFQDLRALGSLGLGAVEFGGAMSPPTGEFAQAPIVSRHPARTAEEAWALEPPSDVTKAGAVPMMMGMSKLEQKAHAPFILLMMPGSWDVAGSLCGLENLCRWIMKKQDLAHRLLRLATDFILKVAGYWADTFDPASIILMDPHPSTSNQIISARHFEQFALPYIEETHRRVIAMGVKHIMSHICGEQNANLPHWAKIPMGNPGIVSIGHEVDIETAGKFFPNDIIMGNVEPAIIQVGPPEKIYELTKTCIEKGRSHPGGFMLAPGCEMPPNAPPYNVWTMTKALNDFGWYE